MPINYANKETFSMDRSKSSIFIKDYYQVGRVVQVIHGCENENFKCNGETPENIKKILFVGEAKIPCDLGAVVEPAWMLANIASKIFLTHVFQYQA